MIMYDKGLPSLPDDIINEIFSLLDMEDLKSCSLTGKALSCSAKPFIHRTLRLHLIPRAGDSSLSNLIGRWYGFNGLPVLGERGLLQYTHYLSVDFPFNPFFSYGLGPYTKHLRTLTNLRSLRTRWMDVPSSIPEVERYFGAFLGSLQSLELDIPRGDHNHILHFACQFPNLRDLKLKIGLVFEYTVPIRDESSHFVIKTSPPLDGTLDLNLGMSVGVESDPVGVRFILKNLGTLPSGLKSRTLKLSWCAGDNLQPLIDACATTLECVEFTGLWSGALFLHRGDCPKLIGIYQQTFPPALGSVSNNTPRSDNLKSIQCCHMAQKVLPDGYPRRSQPLLQTYSPSWPSASPQLAP